MKLSGANRMVVVSVLASVLVAWVGVFLWASRSTPSGVAGARFTALATLTTLLALVAGALAAVFTYPPFSEWRNARTAMARLEIGIEVAWTDYEAPLGVAPDAVVDVPPRLWIVVAVRNTGPISAQSAVINVMVHPWVQLTAVDPEPPEFRVRSTVASVPSLSGDGTIEPVGVAKSQDRDLHPGFAYLYTLGLHAFKQDRYAVVVSAAGLRTEARQVRVWLDPVLSQPDSHHEEVPDR